MLRRFLRPSILDAAVILLLTTLVVAVTVGVVGTAVVQDEEREVRADRHLSLQIVGELTVALIVDWRAERLADARVGALLLSTDAVVARWLRAPGDLNLRADVLDRLAAIQAFHPDAGESRSRYEDVILVQPDGGRIASLEASVADLEPSTQLLVEQVVQSRDAALGDIVAARTPGRVRFDAAAPVLDASGRPVAVLVLRADPSRDLFPRIDAGSTMNETAETIIVRRDGDRVLYLSPLALRDAPPLTLSEPLSRSELAAAAAVGGTTGGFDGVDYRGVEVLADLRPVPGSEWHLVSKVDAEEILAEVGPRGETPKLLGLLAILVTAGAVMLIFGVRQLGLVRRSSVAERRRSAQAMVHERVLTLARDAFLLQDPSGRLVQVNDAAVTSYGYSRDELLRMNVRDLRDPETLAALESQWDATNLEGGSTFETRHVRKDGTVFPVEVSARSVEIGGVLHHQSFVRDISARHAAEAQIRRLTVAYATLAETNEVIARSTDEAEMLQSVCRTAVEFGDYLGAWIGMLGSPPRSLVEVASQGEIERQVREVLDGIAVASREPAWPTALVLADERPHYVDELPAGLADAAWRTGREIGIRAAASVPLRRGGALAGVFTLYAREGHVFDDQVRNLLEEMATDVSFALDTLDREAARVRSEEALAASQAQLASQLDELRRWSDATLGREGRILELKHEVNALLARLGEPPRYESAADDPAAARG